MVTVFLNGQEIDAVIDTGSGMNNVACSGATVPDGSRIKLINPDKTPPLTLIPKTSYLCKNYVKDMVNSMIEPPAMSGACEFDYLYVDKSYLRGRIYQGTLTFKHPSIGTSEQLCHGLFIQLIIRSNVLFKHKRPLWHGLGAAVNVAADDGRRCRGGLPVLVPRQRQ